MPSAYIRCAASRSPLAQDAVRAGLPDTAPCPESIAAIATCYTAKHETGAYLFAAMPKSWNGNLVVFAHGSGELFTVDTAIRGRTDTLYSGRFEGGVRFDGRGGALELFAGVEHRLDADPHDYLPLTWAIAGFRMVSK